MRICPKCRTSYPDKGRATCPQDGSRLVDAREFAEAQADPLLGRTIGGRFHIRERVGTGGMGTVYRAGQSGLDRDVALKILKKELNWDQDTVTRFHREAKAMSLLTHANTVRVFDFGETQDGLLYFAMELLVGELLTSRIERDGAVDVHDAVRLAQQVLGSLHEAHSKGIIHRDLKPDNIFLAQVEGHSEAVVKVLDFGIAKIVQGDHKVDQLETQAGTVFGTPRYMSPEQAQGKTLDARSDLYSVGILLYHMLTGRPPFVDDDAVVVMAKHIRERPEPLRAVAPDRPIPPSLERLVMRAVDKEPAGRFASAKAFADKLEECLPDVRAAVVAGDPGTRSRVAALLGDLPPIPLAVGGAMVAGALALALYMVSSSGAAEAGAQIEPRPGSPADAPPAATAASPAGAASPRAGIEVRVDSRPSGAHVWADGNLLGTTPLALRLPPRARMAAEIRLEGYETAPVELVAGAPPRQVRLSPIAGLSRAGSPPSRRHSTRRRPGRAHGGRPGAPAGGRGPARSRGSASPASMGPAPAGPTSMVPASNDGHGDYERW